MDERRRGVSRRGLFGVLGRGMKGLSEGLADGAKELAPQTPPPPAPERIQRPDEECAPARGDGYQAYRADRGADSIPVGGSLCLRGDELPEPIVVVRVHEQHVAACSGECSYDGSDILWAGDEDRLRCPACDSRWRLDGEPMTGPAQARLASFSVEREPGGLRITAWE